MRSSFAVFLSGFTINFRKTEYPVPACSSGTSCHSKNASSALYQRHRTTPETRGQVEIMTGIVNSNQHHEQNKGLSHKLETFPCSYHFPTSTTGRSNRSKTKLGGLIQS